MSRSLALSLNGNSSIIYTSFFHLSILICIIRFQILMKKIISFRSVTMLLQLQFQYELNDIADFIYNKLKDYNLENTFKIKVTIIHFKLKKLPCESQFTLIRKDRLNNCLVSIKNY